MISINVVASGSRGNCYTVYDGKTTLVLEAGVKPKLMERVIMERVIAGGENIAGALITHEHKDHAVSAKFLVNRGITLFASRETLEATGVSSYACYNVVPCCCYNIGSYTVMPFDVDHDARYPLGFYIRSENTDETIVFATDTAAIYNRFARINYLMIECNYLNDILNRNEAEGRINKTLADRIRNTHFSLDDVKAFIKANSTAMNDCKEIYLIHSSVQNGNKEFCTKEIEQMTGIPTYAFGG